MEGITIIKLLSHHFHNDGRILVRLSHINRLWKKLLRRYPDGALFLFCQKACERLFINLNYTQSQCVEVFFLQLQRYKNEMSIEYMFRDMALYQTPELYRPFVRSRIQCQNIWRATYECSILYDRAESRLFLIALWDKEGIVREYGRYVWKGEARTLNPHYGIFVLEKLHHYVMHLNKRRRVE